MIESFPIQHMVESTSTKSHGEEVTQSTICWRDFPGMLHDQDGSQSATVRRGFPVSHMIERFISGHIVQLSQSSHGQEVSQYFTY